MDKQLELEEPETVLLEDSDDFDYEIISNSQGSIQYESVEPYSDLNLFSSLMDLEQKLDGFNPFTDPEESESVKEFKRAGNFEDEQKEILRRIQQEEADRKLAVKLQRQLNSNIDHTREYSQRKRKSKDDGHGDNNTFTTADIGSSSRKSVTKSESGKRGIDVDFNIDQTRECSQRKRKSKNDGDNNTSTIVAIGSSSKKSVTKSLLGKRGIEVDVKPEQENIKKRKQTPSTLLLPNKPQGKKEQVCLLRPSQMKPIKTDFQLECDRNDKTNSKRPSSASIPIPPRTHPPFLRRMDLPIGDFLY